MPPSLMLTASAAAIRALPATTISEALQRRHRGRVVFAVSLLLTTLVSLALNEIAHWRLAVDTGIELDRLAIVDRVDDDRPAARAGVPLGRRLWAIDDVDIHVGGAPGVDVGVVPRVFVEHGGRLFLRPGPTTVVLHVDDDTNPRGCATPLDLVLQTDLAPTWARLPHTSFIAPWLLAAGIVLSLLLAGITGSFGIARRRDVATSDFLTASRRRERALVWPAFSIAVVVPLWAHVAMADYAGMIAPGLDYFLIAALFTAMAHLRLVFVVVDDCARVVIGDVEHGAHWKLFVVAAIVPGISMVLPTLLVLGIGLPLLLALRRDVRRVAAASDASM